MLTIHVGLHKTGTTAIQSTLAGMSRKELRGVRYRGKGSSAADDGFLSGLPAGFRVPSGAENNPTVRLLMAGHRVVLSNESFLGRFPPHVGGQVYPHAASHAAFMRDYFEARAEFQVVIYLRAQDQWLESLYGQYAKSLVTTTAVNSAVFAEHIMNEPYFRWRRLIDDLKEQLGPGRLIVRPYQPSLNAPTDFLAILGVPIPQRLEHSTIENSSLTPAQLALQQQLSVALAAAGETHLLSWLRHFNNQSASPSPTHKYSYFSEEIQTRLREITASDWHQLASSIADTHLAEPDRFLEVAHDAEQSQIKPYLGTLDTVNYNKEAIQLLVEALPYVQNHPVYRLRRGKKLASRLGQTACTDPKGLPRAVSTYLRRIMYRRGTLP